MLEVNPGFLEEIDKLPSLDPFFEFSPDLLCIAGFDGYFKRINPAVSKLLGYTEEELYSRPINDFVYEKDKNITDRLRDNLRRDVPLLNFENRYQKKNGEIVWLAWTSIPIASSQLVYAIAKDVTHKKTHEEDRNKLIADLSKLNNELKQINYTTAHDLRSPVNNLLSVFGLMDISKIQDAETLEFIEILRLSTENLKETLNKYVDVLSQRNNHNVGTQILSLEEVVQSVIRSLSALIQDSGTTVNINFQEADEISFNKAYLESIFLNLVSNSIKYARSGIAPVISVKSRKVNEFIQVVFTDNGQGFNMEQIKDKVFGLNQKFHNYSDSKGIGLYLVYNHVTSLGGHITLDSKPNEGATFTITFRS